MPVQQEIAELSERDWQQQVITLATHLGWNYYHTHDSRHSPAGFPDLVLWRPGGFILAELKRESGKLSQKQEEVIMGLAMAFVDVRVWRPSDIDEVIETLRGPAQ